jgi:2-oxo-4-hydroxy-4-carboxy-5-ureidoimidazoline decarboxylase
MATAIETTTTLEQLSAADEATFVATLGGIFEDSPWIARGAWRARPFASVDALHAALIRSMRTAPAESLLSLVMALPELAGKLTTAGLLTGEALIEQTGAGFDRCTPDELARLRDLNQRYRERFGFPFVTTIRGHDRQDVVRDFEARLRNDSQTEFDNCLTELEKITRLRLDSLLRRS